MAFCISCFIFVLLFILHPSTATTILGLPLEKASFYVPEKDFTCLDGSTTVPFTFVNDDYCDCSDGSDEPGTSACPDNLFYCPNKGHRATYVLSSRVNDKICDCCDGSDEWGSGTVCQNTCEEMGRKAMAELKQKQEAYAQGYDKMLDYSRQGEEKKAEYQKELTQLENDIGVVESEILTLRLAKDDAEEPEQKAKEEHEKRWNEAVADRKATKRLDEARKMFDQLDKNSDGRVTAEEIMNHLELDDDGDNVVSREEANRYLDELESVDFETFLERVWDAIAANMAKRKEERESREKEKVLEGDREEDDEDGDDEEEEEREEKREEEKEEMPPYDEQTKKLIENADNARKELEDAESRKRNFENRRNEVQKYLNVQLGDSEQFAPLYHQCYEYTDREYTYKLCMFQKITQRNKNGGHETSLGEWEKWDGGSGTQYSVMKYSNGEKCWNGPNRSTVVSLKCGVEEVILSAGEPNRCEYAMEFITPALCLERSPPHLHTEL